MHMHTIRSSMQTRPPSVLCTAEFLQGLRDVATAEGAVLCFDEVMTGFRIAKGCAQVRFFSGKGLGPGVVWRAGTAARASHSSSSASRSLAGTKCN